MEEVLRNERILRNYMEVRYESLVADPKSVMREVIDFCCLDPHGEHERYLPDRLPDMNRKWRDNLDGAQVAILECTIGRTLREMGYLD